MPRTLLRFNAVQSQKAHLFLAASLFHEENSREETVGVQTIYSEETSELHSGAAQSLGSTVYATATSTYSAVGYKESVCEACGSAIRRQRPVPYARGWNNARLAAISEVFNFYLREKTRLFATIRD